MANATVEKLKVFGLRHGEKIVVGLTATICLVLFGVAWSQPVISLTPDELKKAAAAAESNINRPQTKESIIALLDERDKLINPGFVKTVDERKPGSADASKYSLAYAWVSPEPGAGLIRDQPELIAPIALNVNAGRGSIKVFKRDENGELVFSEEKEKPKTGKKKKNRGGGGPMAGMMGGMMGGSGKAKGKGKSKTQEEAERKKADEAEAERVKGALAGELKEQEKPEEDPNEGRKPDVENKGVRWVALVGILEHQKLRDLYAKALKDPNASPHYVRLDVERQTLAEDGNWSKWAPVNRAETERILGEIQMQEEEFTPENVRLAGLVDRLPFLEVGNYRGVHVASLVDRSKIKLPEKKAAGKAKGAAGGGMAAGYAGMMSGGGGDYSEMMRGSMGRMNMGGMMGMGSSGGDGATAPGSKSDVEKVMIRALDYQVEPDDSYRYRVRIVVKNPNYQREDVTPGIDTESEELSGPWSEVTSPVTVPADVTTYARQIAMTDKKGESVQFQVVKWNEKDGLTLVKYFDAAPGEVIGEPGTGVLVPAPDNKGTKGASIDFVSRQLLVDTEGGVRDLASLGTGGTGRFEAPAQALVLRPDGQLVVRDQSRDSHNPEMRQMKEIYDQILQDAKEGGKKKPAGGPAGMMGGYGGMMGGGMMGGGGMR